MGNESEALMIEGRQIRAARGLLGWSRSDLILASGVSLSALLRLESAQADSRSSTLNKVIAALNAAGIEFINDGQNGVGVLARPVSEAG
jgi:predicted transcriptional regulator